MCRDEPPFPGCVECHGFLVALNRSRPITQGFLGKSQGIPSFHVGRVYPESGLKFRSRDRPVILDRGEFAQVEIRLGGGRVVLDSLLELYSRRIEPSYNHKVAAKDFVGLCVSDVELERLRQRSDGVPDFPLRELAVPQGIPTPGGVRVLFDISVEERLDILKTSLTDVLFEFAHECRVVCRALFFGKCRDSLSCFDVTWV